MKLDKQADESGFTYFAKVSTSLLPFFVFAGFVVDSVFRNNLCGFTCLSGLLLFLLLFRFLVYLLEKNGVIKATSDGESVADWCSNYDYLRMIFTQSSDASSATDASAFEDTDTDGEAGFGDDTLAPAAATGQVIFPCNLFVLAFALTYVVSFAFLQLNARHLEAVFLQNSLFITLGTLLLVANSYFVYARCGKRLLLVFLALFLGWLSGVTWCAMVCATRIPQFRYLMGADHAAANAAAAAPDNDTDPHLGALCDALDRKRRDGE